MSDTEFDTLTPASAFKSKIAQPDLYYGERDKLEDWLLQVDLYFHFMKDEVEDKNKVTMGATYMRGKAAKWIKPNLKKYLAGDNTEGDDVDQLMEDYDIFKEKARQFF